MNQAVVTKSFVKRTLSGAAVLAVFGLVIYVLCLPEMETYKQFLLNEAERPWLFAVLMAVLPVFGFPITVFLVLAGMKFGTFWGIVLTGATFLLHLVCTYMLANSVLRPYITWLLSRTRYDIPRSPSRSVIYFAIMFMAVPGLSYTIKNYLIALSGIEFRHYFPICWIINMLLGIPLIGLGGSASAMNTEAIVLFVALLVLVYLIVFTVRRRFQKTYR